MGSESRLKPGESCGSDACHCFIDERGGGEGVCVCVCAQDREDNGKRTVDWLCDQGL